MTGAETAWAANEFLRAMAGPASAVVVSVYVIKSLFHLVVRFFDLIEKLAIRREEHDDDAPKP